VEDRDRPLWFSFDTADRFNSPFSIINPEILAAEYGEGSLTNRMQGWLGADLWRQKDGWTLSHQVLKQQKILSLAGRLPLKAWNAGILTKVLVLNIVLSY
jgi:hypothetical protein